MSNRRIPRLDELNDAIEELEVYNFITRDSDLQRQSCDRLNALLERVTTHKQDAIERHDENMANILLGFECAVGYLHASISMWLLLKQDNPDKAWGRMVDAQRLVADAARAHPGFAHFAKYGEMLQALERLIFPPQKFMSLGMIVRKRLCSICDKEYGECDHVSGRPYMGRLCHTIVSEIEEMNHVALVDNPANKNARIVEFSVPGGRRNRMTWKVMPGEIAAPDAPDGRKGLEATAILADVNEREY